MLDRGIVLVVVGLACCTRGAPAEPPVAGPSATVSAVATGTATATATASVPEVLPSLKSISAARTKLTQAGYDAIRAKGSKLEVWNAGLR